MKKEDKELLLKDLCSRLPYGVICHYNCVTPCDGRLIKKTNTKDVLKGIIPMSDGHIGFMVGIDKVDALEGDIKPYLRSILTMTDEEREEYQKFIFPCPNYNGKVTIGVYHRDLYKVQDWLNARHFDYRGLIEKNLAIAVTKENNPYK